MHRWAAYVAFFCHVKVLVELSSAKLIRLLADQSGPNSVTLLDSLRNCKQLIDYAPTFCSSRRSFNNTVAI
jgi:hypothetical protein